MSKMTDYQSGREDGMLLAEQLVKDGGLERLREEIKYRGITGVHTQLANKELEKASEQIKMNTLDTVILLAVSTIRDEFDFGAKKVTEINQPNGKESIVPDRRHGNMGRFQKTDGRRDRD